tara:strand:- start:116 stop:310 length:195 start_codon:yes stop_codon:yes gene_type:complete
MSPDSKEVLHDVVHRRKALQVGSRLEAAHLALALAGWWETSARLFAYRSVQWTTDGITVRQPAG